MAITSAAFLVLSLVFAVLFGTQTTPWTWGPAMLSLLLATAAALVVLIKQPSRMLNPAMLALSTLTVAWFGIRALQSPVQELGQADLLLLGGTLGGFLSVLAIQHCRRAQWVLTGGIAALLLANLVVMIIQKANPGYRPLLVNTTDLKSVTGFFTHYNYAASYLLVSALWLLGQAWNSQLRVIRIALGLLGALGIAAIWWTSSRGGLLAAIIAMAFFGGFILIEAKRRKAAWFPVAAIAIPFVALILMGLLLNGWQEIQSTRSHDGSGEIAGVLDNTVRLNYLSIAVSSMASHLLLGGGSQSFSWECFQYWENASHGGFYTKPEFVHNEWLQAASDYGLIGFGLLFALLAIVCISAVLRLCFEPKATSAANRTTTLRLAGFAALVGMLTHSNFSFIFHLMPGALMLGMCMAATCQWQNPEALSKRAHHLQRGLFGALGLMLLFTITPLAWKGTRVMAALWPSQYSKHRDQRAGEQLEALNRAIQIWPQASLLMQRGLMRHELALVAEDAPNQLILMDKAIGDYAAAQKHHPYLPEAAINRANLLSSMGRNEEADTAYTKAIELQGGMEPTFRAHYLYALHMLKRGRGELQSQQYAGASFQLEQAAKHMELAPFLDPDGRATEISIHEALGLAYELSDQPEKALKSYDHAATIHYGDGRGIHLRAALLQAAQANEQLTAREPVKALQLYLEAKQSISKTGGRLPDKITAEQRSEFSRMLDERIKRLREIGIKTPEEF